MLCCMTVDTVVILNMSETAICKRANEEGLQYYDVSVFPNIKYPANDEFEVWHHA